VKVSRLVSILQGWAYGHAMDQVGLWMLYLLFGASEGSRSN